MAEEHRENGQVDADTRPATDDTAAPKRSRSTELMGRRVLFQAIAVFALLISLRYCTGG